MRNARSLIPRKAHLKDIVKNPKVALERGKKWRVHSLSVVFATKRLVEEETFEDIIAKRVPCSYEGCKKSFARNDDSLRHVRLVHEQVRPHQCSTCSHSFGTTTFKLKRHEELCRNWSPQVWNAYFECYQQFVQRFGKLPATSPLHLIHYVESSHLQHP